MELGYHEAAGSRGADLTHDQVHVILSTSSPTMCPAGWLSPGCHQEERDPRAAANRRLARHPCGPGQFDDLAAGRAPSSPVWGSSRATPDPTSATTTRTPRPASRRSGTGRAVLIGKARSRMPGTSARGSMPGTTPATATAGSRCSPPETFSTAGRANCSKAGPMCSPVPMPPTPYASSSDRRPRPVPADVLDQPAAQGGAASLICRRGRLTQLDTFHYRPPNEVHDACGSEPKPLNNEMAVPKMQGGSRPATSSIPRGPGRLTRR